MKSSFAIVLLSGMLCCGTQFLSNDAKMADSQIGLIRNAELELIKGGDECSTSFYIQFCDVTRGTGNHPNCDGTNQDQCNNHTLPCGRCNSTATSSGCGIAIPYVLKSCSAQVVQGGCGPAEIGECAWQKTLDDPDVFDCLCYMFEGIGFNCDRSVITSYDNNCDPPAG